MICLRSGKSKLGEFLLLCLVLTVMVAFYVKAYGLDNATASSATIEGASRNEKGSDETCERLAVLLDQQKAQLLRETGQLKREIAALRDDLSKPGVKEIFAGIGYILGLVGVAFYFHCRRTQGRRPEGDEAQLK